MVNRNGDYISAQISEIGAITFTDGQPFELGRPFNLKNDGDAAVELEVNLWGMERGVYVKTRFETGWNPEIIAQVKPTTEQNLLWGN
jgi:hypothetical protein